MVTEPSWTATPDVGSSAHWVTSVVDGEIHVIADVEMTAGIEAGQGIYLSMCRLSVVTAAMTAPPRRMCPVCLAALHPPARSRQPREISVARHRHRRPGWLRMWVASVFAAPGEAGTSRTVRCRPAEGWVWPS
jgi:hypothetical protein